MKITIGGWFKLPRMGTAVFSALMKEGVKYDSESGFMLSSDTDIESAVRTIGSALSEPIELGVRCLICWQLACEGCPYFEACDRRRVSPKWLWGEHYEQRDIYDSYQKV